MRGPAFNAEEIRIAVGPRHALLLTWLNEPCDGGAVPVGDDLAAHLNRAVISQREDEWFHHPDRRPTTLVAPLFSEVGACSLLGRHLLPGYDYEAAVIWATAMYGGLRREVQALRAEDVDLAPNGVIRVEFGWEYREGQIPLKSDAGRRKVPISAVLRDFLDARIAACGYSGSDRLFGLATGERTFDPSKLTKRADRAWRGCRA